ncbi:MarR family transcriptional regulator [Streptomyces sp. MNU76]|uniref:MarR family transcriptional regulator n=1 Tax=Streptomyces sp. MNU76 TaxID=2560026 RepID=UPI001E4A92DB|nr:helix-turn-helix domain-containing protein [Streptomyces sp. MNU76]MCC9707125.1 MarR family transcriptional regulator [Streptomyces sp. MNU76]
MIQPVHQLLPVGITALGLANAVAAHSNDNPAALGLSLALALCGILLGAADIYETSLRRDAAIVAHLARHPGARTRHVGNALGIRDATAARSLTRLTKAGLIVRETENETRSLQSFRLSA